MAWTTPPTFTVGEVLTAATMNALGTDIGILATYVPTYGVVGAISGSAPTAGTPVLLMQTGRSSVSPSSGAFTISLPSSFPNSIISVLFTPTPSATNNDTIQVNNGTTTTSTLAGTWYRAGSAYTGTSACCWVAYGN